MIPNSGTGQEYLEWVRIGYAVYRSTPRDALGFGLIQPMPQRLHLVHVFRPAAVPHRG
jgi:hypothetical protein